MNLVWCGDYTYSKRGSNDLKVSTIDKHTQQKTNYMPLDMRVHYWAMNLLFKV